MNKTNALFSRAHRLSFCYHRAEPIYDRSGGCAMRRLMGMLSWMVVLGLSALVAAQYGDISDVKLAKAEDKEDAKGTPPPAEAKILFDGKTLDGWERRDGKG